MKECFGRFMSKSAVFCEGCPLLKECYANFRMSEKGEDIPFREKPKVFDDMTCINCD
jgi:hypothetical protein